MRKPPWNSELERKRWLRAPQQVVRPYGDELYVGGRHPWDLGVDQAWLDKNGRHDHPMLYVLYRCGCWQTFFQRAAWDHIDMGRGTSIICRVHELFAILGGDVELVFDARAEHHRLAVAEMASGWSERIDAATAKRIATGEAE